MRNTLRSDAAKLYSQLTAEEKWMLAYDFSGRQEPPGARQVFFFFCVCVFVCACPGPGPGPRAPGPGLGPGPRAPGPMASPIVRLYSPENKLGKE